MYSIAQLCTIKICHFHPVAPLLVHGGVGGCGGGVRSWFLRHLLS